MAIELIKRAELQVVDPESVKLRGYAAVFNNVFAYIDPVRFKVRKMRIAPGAFAQVQDIKHPVPLVWYHQSERIQFGETTDVREDSVGLYFEGRPFATTEAVDLITAMAQKANKRFGASFAFEWGDVDDPDSSGVETINSFASVDEMGPCPRGVNPLAYIELVPRDAAADTASAEPAVTEPAPEAAALAAALWRATAMLRSR